MISGFITDLLNAIQMIGYLQFGLIILADIILGVIHPVLGYLGVIITLAYIFHFL